ncbi:hypothetical protein, partial [Rosenbergiella collisarenosi]
MGRYDDFFEDETPTVTPTEFSPTPTVEPQADAPAAVTPSPESAENVTTELENAPDVPKTEEQAPQGETQAPADDTSSDNEASSSDTSATSSDTHDTAEVPETEQPTAPVVPSAIAGKQQSTSLKPRYQGDSEF